jgi:hypothetical protein
LTILLKALIWTTAALMQGWRFESYFGGNMFSGGSKICGNKIQSVIVSGTVFAYYDNLGRLIKTMYSPSGNVGDPFERTLYNYTEEEYDEKNRLKNIPII